MARALRSLLCRFDLPPRGPSDTAVGMEIFAAIRHNSAAYRVAEALRLPKLRSLTIALHPSGCQREGSLTMRCLWLVGLSLAASVSAAESAVDYQRDVKPILRARCFSCHGALKQESGLRLDTGALIRQGGDSGPALVPGEAANSLVLRRITATDESERMPPEGKPLTKEQIAVIRSWIAEGAESPPGEQAATDPRQHWSFQPPVRPSIPVVTNTNWGRNPIDAFIAAAHQKHGLTPLPPAKKSLLLRRVYLDLIGLPPNREQLRTFLSDDSPDAYERVVDQLLESRHYGERWGRHWMDVWRYSDWTGFGNEIRYSQPHIWRWRDWIVESLNADKGYDRMILEMLAADELSPRDERAIRATGFLARNWYKFDRDSWLDDTIEHTCKALLAMTMKCARCHDHKYDPISQLEYYQLRSVFEPYDVRTDHTRGETDLQKHGVARVYDAKLDRATYLYERGDPKQPDKSQAIAPGVPSVVNGPMFEPQVVQLPLASYYPALRTFVVEDLLAEQQRAVALAERRRSKAQRVHATLMAQSQAGVSASVGPADEGPEANEDLHSAPTKKNTKLKRELAQAVQALRLADLKWKAAGARRTAITARIAAERAKHRISRPTGLNASDRSAVEADPMLLAAQAAKAERLATLASAEEATVAAQHQLELARSSMKSPDKDTADKAIKEAEAKLAAAKKKQIEAQTAADKESSSYQPLGPTHPQQSTGRRLAFARWVVDSTNPLTARVAINHIWLRHFGRPLVEGVDDFGLRSPPPDLGRLLDFLAVELMENQWQMKSIHRLIVTSSAYRMQSSSPTDNPSRQQDRDNLLFWRMNVRRLEAEAVRDTLLYLGGSLDQTLGGPDLDHKQDQRLPRRSLYFRNARERQVKFLRIFDVANPRECYRRQPSIRPQQAYALVNSALSIAQSRRLTKRLHPSDHRPFDDDGFVAAAFEVVLSRQPNSIELTTCRQFLQQQREQLSKPDGLELLNSTENAVAPATDSGTRARENLVLVLFNHNDFVTVR